MILLHNHGEGGSSFVQLGPQLEPLDIGRFLASVRFEHKRKLDELGIEIGSLSTKMGE
jgi:hypothetical protein